jgi:mono/diheme cytochrome c family protein
VRGVVAAVLFVVTLALRIDAATPAASAEVATRARVLVDTYCVTCHNEKLKTGGLVLEHRDVASPTADPALWEKVIRKLRTGTMPPPAARQPDRGARSDVASWLEASLDAASASSPNPGRALVHRLNRTEYANAVRDVLGVEIDARAMLPADDASYGFDNVADVLSVTPGLLERYLLVAKKISRVAVGETAIRPSTDTYKLPISLVQDDRMSEDLPFGTRGGLVARHTFPVDGEYEVRLRLQRNSINLNHVVRGMDDENVISVFVDGSRVHAFVLPPEKPRDAGLIEFRQEPDDDLHFKLAVKAGTRAVGVAFPRRFWYVEGVGVEQMPAASDAFNSGVTTNTQYGKVEMGVDTLEISGPFGGLTPRDAGNRRRIFVCQPSAAIGEQACARRILSALARRAYRRAVTDDDMRTLMQSYEPIRQDEGFERGIQAGIERVLVSPYFLLREEQDPASVPAGAAYHVNDVELASRLSFFLWSTIPDDELLNLATTGRLKEPSTLRQQVTRMLRDSRSQAFLSNFFGQWLYLRNVDVVKPDTKIFPQFDENLRDAFKRETALFLESQVREDHSVLDLLTANYTFLNERLARHYGVSGVYGSHFRRVTLSDGSRQGLLGQGSILTVTSYADRTSPVVRGKWLLENLLGAPPPPPPANVPPFPSNAGGEAPKSVRARMEMHRRNPVCASCHSRIDPLGFALENFNAVGQYRTFDDGSPVDASGKLPDGTVFNGPAEFRQALLTQRDQIVTSLTEKLLTYSLGRGVEYYDQPAVRQIVRATAAGGYRWSVLITNLVQSVPFGMRRAAS